MMTANPALRAIADVRRVVRDAVDQAKLGYEFVPNSYTFGCLSACLAAEKAVDVLGDNMSDHFETSSSDRT